MTWNPDKYLSFVNIRLRPAMDLIARIPPQNFGTIYDLGSGTGNVTNILQKRWPEARVVGVDSSPEMLARARGEYPNLEWEAGDIGTWRRAGESANDIDKGLAKAGGERAGVGAGVGADAGVKASIPATNEAREAPDLIFSNAALQWVPGHERLIPELFGQLGDGGWLAIQMPRHIDDPGHVLIIETANEKRWRDKVAEVAGGLRVHSAEDYWRWLREGAAELDIWETIYQHELEGENPVVNFFLGTQLRPYLDKLEPEEQEQFLAAYGEKVRRAYPRQANGKTLFPFRRLFILARRGGRG